MFCENSTLSLSLCKEGERITHSPPAHWFPLLYHIFGSVEVHCPLEAKAAVGVRLCGWGGRRGKKVSKDASRRRAQGSSQAPTQVHWTTGRSAFYGKSMKTLRDVNSPFDTRPDCMSHDKPAMADDDSFLDGHRDEEEDGLCEKA